MDEPDKWIQELRKYVNDEYTKQIDLDIASKIIPYASTKNRFAINLQMMKLIYTFPRMGTLCTCFKLTRKDEGADSTTSIYAYLYSTATEHIYTCTSPTFNSHDGEYRHRVLPWSQFLKLFESYQDIFALVEKMILADIENKLAFISADVFYPFDFIGDTRKFEEAINTDRLAIKLFVLAWIRDYHQISIGIMENHINAAYQFNISDNDDTVYESIKKIMSPLEFAVLTNINVISYTPHINRNVKMVQRLFPIECGQKIIPMTWREVIDAENINFPVWREIYINSLCSNLVINLISPSFPVINGWFYIQNVHAGIFDNMAMHEKYIHGKIATNITQLLRRANKMNYTTEKDPRPINSKFLKLSSKVMSSITYAESSIRLTDVAICIISEHVGRTFRDIPLLSHASSRMPGFEIYSMIFNRAEVFAKHLFEYFYACYCMNIKLGIMHSDLHLNNVTIFKLYDLFTEESKLSPEFKNPHIVYVLGSQTNNIVLDSSNAQDIFMFEHYGAFSTIIDFSRCIIGNKHMIEKDFGISFAANYFKVQRDRVLRVLYHYFPKFVDQYKDKLLAIMISDFSLIFKVITAIDPYSIVKNMITMLKYEKMEYNAEILNLLSRIEIMAEKFILESLHGIINFKLTKVDEIAWPCNSIIKACFAEYSVAKLLKPGETLATYIQANNIMLLDVFNINSDMKYDIQDQENYPPYLSLNKEIELLKKYNLPLDEDHKKWSAWRSVDTQETAALDMLVKKYADESTNMQLDYAASSWMME